MKKLVILTTILFLLITKTSSQLALGGLTKTVGDLPVAGDVVEKATGGDEGGDGGLLGGGLPLVGGGDDDDALLGGLTEALGGGDDQKGGLLGLDGVELLPGQDGQLLDALGVADADLFLTGEKDAEQKNKPSILGANIAGLGDQTNLDKWKQHCDPETGVCTAEKQPDVINLDLGLMKKESYKWTVPVKDNKYLIIRNFKAATPESNNIFGKGVSRPKSDKNSCNDYKKCKKLLINPAAKRVEAPYLYDSPYFVTKQTKKGVVKQVVSQNYLAQGFLPGNHADPHDKQYLQEFMENLYRFSALYDNYGTCPTYNFLTEQTAIYTLDALPCDIFYTALRLYDIENDKHTALTYNNFLISLDELAGIHWYKLGTEAEVVEQLIDTERLQKLYELLVVQHNTLDETAFFALKQDISPLCTPDKEKYKTLKCPKTSYYSYDGTCNNPENPLVGKNPSSLVRLAASHCPVNNCQLPGARTLSLSLGYITNFLTVPKGKNHDFSDVSLFGLFFMKFAINDIVKIDTKGPSQQGGVRGCTKEGQKLPDSLVHPYSSPIDIPKNDAVYGKFNVTCLEFVKAQRYNGECLLTEANIGNFASAYLDLSQLYPKSVCEADGYLAPGGKIKESLEKFPHISDQRAYQSSLLTAVTALFALLHNEIATRIKQQSPTLSDYETFQEARLITIYLYQHFYDSYVLPAIVGHEYAHYQGVTNVDSCYNPKLDPSPLTEFSSSVAQSLHVYLPNQFNFLHPDFSVKFQQDFSRNYGGPQSALTEFEACFRGMVHQSVNLAGHAYQPQNSLFKFSREYGADLFSYDIQRSRDMCVKPYIFYVKKLFGVDVKNWEDLSSYIPVEAVLQLKQIYKDVCQLELYAGISVEKKFDDGLFGPVARKIVAEQHLHSRCADSKHYTNALNAEAKNCLKNVRYNEVFATLAGVKTATRNIVLSQSHLNQVYTISDSGASLDTLNCLISAVLNRQ